MTVLITPRLRLRAPELADAPRIAELLNDQSIARNLEHAPHPYTIADAMAWLPKKLGSPTPENTAFLIEHGADGVIGSVGFHPEEGIAEIGYWLSRPHWGNGLMTEAVRAVIAWYFETSGANMIRSGYLADNPASSRILAKLGFVEQGGRSETTPAARTEKILLINTLLNIDNFRRI